MSELDGLITEHSELTRELIQQLRELADMQGKVLTQQGATWLSTSHLPVTERRETIKYSTAVLEAEVLLQVAEVEVLRVQLRDIDLRIKYSEEAMNART